jgi:DNA helicase-2/ATP-dependent DNA helicase PcrA
MAITLTKAQQSVVDHNEGALLVVAGPGSGKTRVVTERIRRLLEIDGQHFRVLALTFTTKAAGYIAERLTSVPGVDERAFIGTIHSFCTEVLANRGKAVGIDDVPNIFESHNDRREVLIEAVRQEPELQAMLEAHEDSRERIKLVDRWLSIIGEYKNTLVLPEMVADPRVSRLYAAYNDQLRASNALDFDDLLLLTYQLFEQRPKIAEFYRRQYRYISIDEAQDLNEAQYRVLCSLCGGEYRNVLMVGDPKQAIFTWNGGHPKYLELFAQDFSASRVELLDNFRSSSAVVRAATSINRDYRVEGELPIQGVVQVKALSDEVAEAQYVADTIADLARNGHADVEGGVRLNRCAVIGRNRFVFDSLCEEFDRRSVQYYKKFGGLVVQSESDLMAEVELGFRIIANPHDRLHVGMLLRRRGVETSLDEIYAGVRGEGVTGGGVLQHIQSLSCHRDAPLFVVMEAMGWGREGFSLRDGLDRVRSLASEYEEDQRAIVLQDVAEWQRRWDTYVRASSGGVKSLRAFLSQVALGATHQVNENGVAMLTVHSAKGMEFDVVFLIGMNEGTFPDYRAKGAALAEERRNVFVAVTRSRRLLYLTYPMQKVMPWGDIKTQQPSRFVRELGL